ncbi:hypothetical protein [Nonomuraea endophytica]|uniref:hypothetical protein n=1 Tax=Nonomuraea endophytica TaxID=714136 RepID=UPI0037C592A5
MSQRQFGHLPHEVLGGVAALGHDGPYQEIGLADRRTRLVHETLLDGRPPVSKAAA